MVDYCALIFVSGYCCGRLCFDVKLNTSSSHKGAAHGIPSFLSPANTVLFALTFSLGRAARQRSRIANN